MTDERLRYIRNLNSLVPVTDHTRLIYLDENEQVRIRDKLPAPVDENGIPRPEIMVQRIYENMTTENYVWTGVFDEHHTATPKADYTVVRSASDGNIGSVFRGLSFLKVELPRQMHNFSHAVFELPRRPDPGVMHQALLEVGQARRLQGVLRDHVSSSPDKRTERMLDLCQIAIHAALENMDEFELELLPHIEVLSEMSLEDLELCVGSLLRVRQFSDRTVVHPAVRQSKIMRKKLDRNTKLTAIAS